jgi:NodT family efflux transporter outer membrane factor (OMF) lipoprotein
LKTIVIAAPVLAAAVVLVGCASAPEYKPPPVEIEAPGMWTAGALDTAAVSMQNVQWWQDFGEARLDTLVEEALAQNYDLVAAAARVDQAAALARIVGADKWPQIAGGFTGARQKNILLGIPIPGDKTIYSNSFGVSLDTQWEIDLWGRIYKAESAALAEVEASWADLVGVRLSIAAQTAKAWFALTEARQQVELAEQSVESFRSSAEFVRNRYQQGVRTALDLRLALAQLASAEALLEFRHEQLDRTTRQLEILLGRYPAAAIEAQPDLPPMPEDVPGGLPSALLIRRPDLVAAERRYAGTQAKISEARRAFFPRITLTANGGTLSQQVEDLVKGDFSVWSVAAGLTQPIFQGGRLRANLAQSHATADQALAGYALSLLHAFGEVESAIVAEERLAKRVKYTQEAADQSVAAQTLAERQYAAGLVDYITVLETQRRALTSVAELISVKRARLDARINLHVALGGGFDLDSEWNQFLVAKSQEDSEPTEDPEENE